jgi:ribulose-phosphate 3-epimerase
MSEIIPAMLTASEQEFRDKVAKIGSAVEAIQVDVMDDTLVKNTSWADPEIVKAMALPYRIEVHLMVLNPAKAAAEWIAAGAETIIPHAEAPGWQEAARLARAAGRKAGVAVNPETPLSAIAADLALLDMVLVMGVTPGWSGQSFQPVATEKVRELRRLRPELRIEVDGGVGLANARELAAAGADSLVAASALWKADDFTKACQEFNEATLV